MNTGPHVVIMGIFFFFFYVNKICRGLIYLSLLIVISCYCNLLRLYLISHFGLHFPD